MKLVDQLKRWVGAGDAQGRGAIAPGATRVLVVCTGNICRSPMAEGVLRAKLAAAGLAQQVAVDSAGTHGYHTSEAPDPRAVRIAAARGYDIARLRARPVVPEDFQTFQWMLALDEGHYTWLNKRAPQGAPVRIERLMDHARRHAGIREVPDPYYGPDAGFEQVLNLVEDACEGWVQGLRAAGAGRA